MGKRKQKHKQKISNCYDIYFEEYGKAIFEGLIDLRWLKAMAVVESGLNPKAVSKAGAIGVMQLMPGTASDMAERLNIPDAPLFPHINIRMGILYARRCWNIWKKEKGVERLRFMLGSYNAGPANMIEAQKLAHTWGLPTDEWASIIAALPEITGPYAQETIVYVARVESLFETLKEE